MLEAKTKDQGHKAQLFSTVLKKEKKKVTKNIFLTTSKKKVFAREDAEFIGVARIFDWGVAQTTYHMQWSHQKFSKKGTFCGAKIS